MHSSQCMLSSHVCPSFSHCYLPLPAGKEEEQGGRREKGGAAATRGTSRQPTPTLSPPQPNPTPTPIPTPTPTPPHPTPTPTLMMACLIHASFSNPSSPHPQPHPAPPHPSRPIPSHPTPPHPTQAPEFDQQLVGKRLEVFWKYIGKDTNTPHLIWCSGRVARVADGLTDKRSKRAQNILPGGAVLWAWDEDSDRAEVAGERWLILLPSK